MLKRVIISAPFGNWIERPDTTSTLGTYTLKNRGGIWYRLWRMLLTLRYHRQSQSWINKLGLPNPGLGALPKPNSSIDYRDNIISIYGFNKDEWRDLAKMIVNTYQPSAVELNLSCPNVDHHHFISDIIPAIDILTHANIKIIAKLPPLRWMSLAKPLYAYGIRTFHCCNTIPTPGGGFSGKALKQYSLWCINDLRNNWGNNVEIIGGGGINSNQDVDDYADAGADRIAVGSMLLNPFRWKDLDSISALMKQKKLNFIG